MSVQDEVRNADVVVSAVPLDEGEIRVLVPGPGPHDGGQGGQHVVVVVVIPVHLILIVVFEKFVIHGDLDRSQLVRQTWLKLVN